jgi:fatty acid desaturase
VSDAADPRAEIERLEAQIEALAEKARSCRKLMVGARVAMALGGGWLIALMAGALWFDALRLVSAITLALGGLVVYGSNRSTLEETQAAIRAAEARRAALIGGIGLRLVQ